VIPVATIEAEVKNTLGGEKIKMTFDEDSIDDLMVLMTVLYSDEQAACIREYSTNARDAHLQKGNTDVPIEVRTPNVLDPYLRIKDQGVGLSADDIRHMYSKYGGSSKRLIAEQNGSMGLGAKAALGYTNQFSLVSVKDGKKVHVSVSRTATGGGEMEIIDESDTTEPSGTEIIIPTQRINNFEAKALKFFRYWEKGTVLLNGVDPSKREKLVKVTDRIYIDPDGGYDDCVFMGNVPYPVTKRFGTLRQNGSSLVAFVTMGGDDQVKFTPSREGLIYNTQTERVLDILNAEYDKNIIHNIQDEIDKASSKQEAITLRNQKVIMYNGWQKDQVLTYKGEVMPSNTDLLKYTVVPFLTSRQVCVWYPGRSRNVVQHSNNTMWTNVRWVVYNYPNGEPSNDHRRKTRMYVTDTLNKGFGGQVVYTNVDKSVIHDTDWYNDRFIDWAEIRKIRIKRTPSAGASEEWNVYEKTVYGGYYAKPKDDIDPDQQIIYWSSAKQNDIYTDRLDVLTRHFKNAMLVREPVNRHARLKRLFPNAMSLTEALPELKKMLQKEIKPSDFAYSNIHDLSMGDTAYRLYKYSQDAGYMSIKDPDLVALCKAWEGRHTQADKSQAYRDMTTMAFTIQEPDGTTTNKINHTYIVSNYPLLSAIQTYGLSETAKKELIQYVNFKYNERKAK
jgi:hypothetical protein